MSAKTAESLETPQEDIWLPQRREGIFSIFKRSIAVKSEVLLPAVLCLANTPPHLSNSAFSNSGPAGLFLRLRWHCLERPPTEESNCYQQGCLFLCFLLSAVTSWYYTTEHLSKKQKSSVWLLPSYLSVWLQLNCLLFRSMKPAPSFPPTHNAFFYYSVTIYLSLSSLPPFLSPKNLQGSINTKMPIYWFIR